MKRGLLIVLFGILLMFINAEVGGQTVAPSQPALYIFPGTQYALVLPNQAFKKQSSGALIKNEQTGASIGVVTEVASPFSAAAAMFLNEKFIEKDTVLSKSDYTNNGYHSRIIKILKRDVSAGKGTQNKGQLLWMMLYGNDSLSILLGATCKDSALSEADDIERALRSFVYLMDSPTDKSEALDFTVSTKNTGLFLADIIGQNGGLYNSSKSPFGSMKNDSIWIMVLPMPVQGDWENRNELVQRKVDLSNAADSLKLIVQRDWTINGFQAHEAVTTNRKKGVTWIDYETRVYLKEKQYLIQGSSRKDPEKSLEIFRMFASSLIPK
jgi:hypothetical protein